MFYSQFILAKKGPLGTIWIAAHLERKLRKNQVADTDIGVSVDSILFPDVPIALRLSSHLLLGVVRIYSRKVNYLFDDCSEALLKVKQAFRSAAVDLPPEESTAPYHSITLPETFDLDDFELPDNELFQGNYVDHHVSTREQITLQDTMDGVVYSTSQFGLDEQFGDGDTSQIALDLDEELFTDRAMIAGNETVSDDGRQETVEAVAAPNKDANIKGISETSEYSEAMLVDGNQNENPIENTEFNEYAQAPPTPGLVEVTNLSSVQEGLACDDHIESEDFNLTESVATERGQDDNAVLDLHLEDRSAMDWAPNNDLNHDHTEFMPLDENDYPEQQKSPDGNGASSNAATMEYISVDGRVDTSHVSNKVEQSSNAATMEYISVDGRVDTSHVSNKVEHIDKTDVPSIDLADRECVEPLGCSDVNSELENPGQPLKTSEVHDDVRVTERVELSCPAEEVLEADAACQVLKEVENLNTLHVDTSSDHKYVLQPCNTHLHEAHLLSSGVVEPSSAETTSTQEVLPVSAASTEMQGCQVAELIQLESNQTSDMGLHGEVQVDSVIVVKQVDNVFPSDSQSELLNGSANSDFPAPETLLSVQGGHIDKPNDFLVESTPDKFLLGVDGVGSETQQVSGKKRSFTESSLTVESLNSVESVGLTRARRTADSIPDDDDLLSSILVGRTSVLKIKPTPTLEVASKKRARTVPRSTTSKRKVLMDDSMVLHGDVIRQQLTNTEDIRRIRKKAPCTLPEIGAIKRQILEEEIFTESVFTGMSVELVSLHCETHDLRGTRISENDDYYPSELVKDLECSPRTNVNGESGMEGSTEPVIFRDDAQAQPSENLIQIETEIVENHDFDTQGKAEVESFPDQVMNVQLDSLGEISELGIDRGGMEVADGIIQITAQGFEISSAPGDLPGAISEMSACEKTDVAAVLVQTNDLKMDGQDIVEDASVADLSNGKGIDHVEAVEHNMENPAAVENYSEARKELLLDENNDGASLEIASAQAGCYTSIDNANSSPIVASLEAGDFVNCDQVVGETGSIGVISNNGVDVTEVRFDNMDPAFYGLHSEKNRMDPISSLEVDIGAEKYASVNDGETLVFEEIHPEGAMDAEIINHDYPAVAYQAESGKVAVMNDTEFLNVDDDDLSEEADDVSQSGEETRILENTGWSSRTRAVAKYLQTLFDKEPIHARKPLMIDNLLAGKTRKEASRMFFETLVLKTKDYIQVEQSSPFDNINIKPRGKLMKSDF